MINNVRDLKKKLSAQIGIEQHNDLENNFEGSVGITDGSLKMLG
jgi:hypothetical protein